jgi:DNA helicase HerA-like ATPase
VKESKIYLILGIKGTGKTYFVKTKLIHELKKPIFIIDPLFEYQGEIITFKEFLNLCKKREFKKNIYILMFDNDYEELKFFDLIFYIGNCSIIIEEADIYQTPQWIEPEISNLIKRGRHKNINLIFVTRRPREINRLISSQADYIITFQQREPGDIEWLRRWAGEIDTEKIKNLKIGEYIKIER